MGILIIIILLFLIVILVGFHLLVNYNIEKWLARLCEIEPKEDIKEEPKVTDNFNKQKEIYSSTSHIIVPKAPNEIRNQNYDKIKEGIGYGDIAKR